MLDLVHIKKEDFYLIPFHPLFVFDIFIGKGQLLLNIVSTKTFYYAYSSHITSFIFLSFGGSLVNVDHMVSLGLKIQIH
jgi:hypothetical protein